jgi:hypothetical protein
MTERLAPDPGEAIPGRPAERMTSEMVEAALAELVDLVRARLPERFHRGEGHWRPLATALIARIAGIGESIDALVPTRRQADAQILLRALYEHVLTYCWIAIDPRDRVYEWRDHAVVQRRRLHNDASRLGIQILSDEQYAEAAELDEIKRLIERADEVDAYWSRHIRGFRPPSLDTKAGLLTFRGLYIGLYRTSSRLVHAQIETVNDCVDFESYPRRPAIVHMEASDDVFWAAIACPLIAMALLVNAYLFRWPDSETVRAINDSLVREEPSVGEE